MIISHINKSLQFVETYKRIKYCFYNFLENVSYQIFTKYGMKYFKQFIKVKGSEDYNGFFNIGNSEQRLCLGTTLVILSIYFWITKTFSSGMRGGAFTNLDIRKLATPQTTESHRVPGCI
jgi:hypothetical protein